MKAGKTILSAITLIILFVNLGCQKETRQKETLTEEIVNAPNSNAAASETVTPPQIYGVWHAGNDFCIWGSVRTVSEFDSKNHWIIDRGNGQPSVNIVILSFVHPL